MPAFALAANIFPLAGTADLQSPGASFAQGYHLSSDKGEISEMGEAEEDKNR